MIIYALYIHTCYNILTNTCIYIYIYCIIFAHHCASTFAPYRAIQAKALVETQLEIQPLAPDLGRRAVASGSKKKGHLPFKNYVFFSGNIW